MTPPADVEGEGLASALMTLAMFAARGCVTASDDAEREAAIKAIRFALAVPLRALLHDSAVSPKATSLALTSVAVSWWESKRPLSFSEADHVANPTINTTSAAEKALANAVAALYTVAAPQEEE